MRHWWKKKKRLFVCKMCGGRGEVVVQGWTIACPGCNGKGHHEDKSSGEEGF